MLTMSVTTERWPFIAPFRIAGHVRDSIEVVVVTLVKDGAVGRGEAAGVRYRESGVASLVREIEAFRDAIESGVTRHSLLRLLPAGGSRNAIDCALWDLEAKLLGCPVWKLADLEPPRPLLTAFTCGADTPQAMATKAREYAASRAIKLKLTGEPVDAERARAVRNARPDVWLSVDANQAFTRESLERLLPELISNRVELIEQPFRIGEEALLDGFRAPISIAADESVQTCSDLPNIVGRFQMINIKLDKCGGLTEALAMAYQARSMGLEIMVGNMGGTSLAMAPAFVLGQLCKVVDLDGPVFLQSDRTISARYRDGAITCPDDLWGSA